MGLDLFGINTISRMFLKSMRTLSYLNIFFLIFFLLAYPNTAKASSRWTWKDAVALTVLNLGALGISMGPTIKNALDKKASLDAAESESSEMDAILRNKIQVTNDKKDQISSAITEISDLDCALGHLTSFQDYTRFICQPNFSQVSISNAIEFIKTTYGLETYQAQDSMSSSSEPIYRTETYQDVETYSCQKPYLTTCADSNGYSYTCTRYRYDTCVRTVTKTRQVFDYTRTTDVFDVRAGTAIRGQTRTETGCNAYNEILGFTSQEEFLRESWDRGDRTHYKDWKQYTTAVVYNFTFDGKLLSQGLKFVVDKTKGFNETALSVVQFVKDRCSETLPVVMNATAGFYEQKKNVTATNLAQYQLELPLLETAEAQAKNNSDQANSREALARDRYNTAAGISAGATVGSVIAINVFYVIGKIIAGKCAARRHVGSSEP